MSSVQVYLPRRAFDALDIPLIIKLARIAGIDRARVESSTYKIPANIPAGSVRVTCSIEMALALVEAFRQQAANADARRDGELLIAAARAVASLLAGIEDARKPWRSSGTEPTPY